MFPVNSVIRSFIGIGIWESDKDTLAVSTESICCAYASSFCMLGYCRDSQFFIDPVLARGVYWLDNGLARVVLIVLIRDDSGVLKSFLAPP